MWVSDLLSKCNRKMNQPNESGMSLRGFPLETPLSEMTVVLSVLKRLPRPSLSSSSLSPPRVSILLVEDGTATDESLLLLSKTLNIDIKIVSKNTLKRVSLG